MTLDLSHRPSSRGEHAFDSNQDRIRKVRAANWVGYGRAKRALERLDELIEQPSCARMPCLLCLLLNGDSGIGKTMIVEIFERMHPANHNKSTGIVTRPVVILQMPPCPDERRFFVRISECRRAPYNPYWRDDIAEFDQVHIQRLAYLHRGGGHRRRSACH